MSFFSDYHSIVIYITYKPSLLLLLSISKYQPMEPKQNYSSEIQDYLSSVLTLLRMKCTFPTSYMENYYAFSNLHSTRRVVRRLA